MKCLNVVAFYENAEEVQKYIEEVVEVSDGKVDICVVVNSDKSDKVQEMVKNLIAKGISSYSIKNYGENVGYLNSLLKAMKDIDVSQYRYYILSNTDIHYLSKDFFDKLIENLMRLC